MSVPVQNQSPGLSSSATTDFQSALVVVWPPMMFWSTLAVLGPPAVQAGSANNPNANARFIIMRSASSKPRADSIRAPANPLACTDSIASCNALHDPRVLDEE